MPEQESEVSFEQEVEEAVASSLAKRELAPAGPEEFFRFGQQVPEAANLEAAISSLYSPSPEDHKIIAQHFDLEPRPFQGSVFPPEELETIRAEQVPRIPTHRNTPVYTGDPQALLRFRWFNLRDFDQHPNRSSFRDRTGHNHPRPVRELPFPAFMYYACWLEVLDWTETLVFYEIFEKPNDQRLPTLHPERFVRFMVAYVRMPFESGTEVPSWLQAEIDEYSNAARQCVAGIHPHHLRRSV